MVCLDLFMAGSKTTTDTLASAFLFLSLNDEWLKILQTELDRVVGRSRAPTEEDLPYLPMMEAFLAEVFKICKSKGMSGVGSGSLLDATLSCLLLSRAVTHTVLVTRRR